MATDATGTGFFSASHESLRAAGLSGATIDVRLAGQALHLTGATGGTVTITVAQTQRMPLGYLNGKHVRVHYARIWLIGRDKPLVLEPVERETPAYGHAMRGFAHTLAAVRGTGSIERGLSAGAAAFALLFPLLPLVMAVALPLFLPALQSEWLWGSLVAITLVLAAASILHFFKRQRPLPVADLQEIEAQLPQPASG